MTDAGNLVADLKDAMREAREVLKDVRSERKAIEHLLGPSAKAAVEEKIGALVRQELAEIAPQLRRQSDAIYQRVGNQVDKLIDLAMGKEFSSARGREDNRPLLAAKLREWIDEVIMR